MYIGAKANLENRRYRDPDYYRRRKLRRRRKRRRAAILITLELAALVLLISFAIKFFTNNKSHIDRLEVARETEIPDWIDVQLIDEGNPSRTGLKLDGVNNIVVHYVGNPQTTAQQNRNFYNQEDSNVCSHFVIGMDGEIIMCVPLEERSSASNHRNHDTISIEVCHPDETGKFTDESYKSLLKLVDWLLDIFALEPDDVIRHYDITGKECPLYYVEHPDAWDTFINNL